MRMTNMATEKKTQAPKAETIKTEDVKSAASTTVSRVAEGTREFVRRSAATAHERADDLYEGSEKLNDNLETALTKVAKGYVGMLSGMATIAHENVGRALTTVEKLAAAKSVSEAVRIQADYLRENTTANFAHLRDAANTTRDVLGNGMETVRDTAANAWPYGRKAA